MQVTLYIKGANSDKQVIVEFSKVYHLHIIGEVASFYVKPGYTQSENANGYNASTEPYHKVIYDVVDCYVKE